MKNHKTLFSFIILGLLLCAFIGITLYSSILSYMEISSQAELKVSGMIDTLNHVQEHIDSLEAEFQERTERSMEMMCIALRPLISGNIYNGPEIFKDGIVVRVEDDKIIYPDDFSGSFELLTDISALENLSDMTGSTLIDGPENTHPVLISAKQIEGRFYYIDWWKTEDYQTSVKYLKLIGEAVTTLEQLYDASLILFEENDEDVTILYASQALGTPEKFEDMGLTREEISSEPANLTINKKSYSATYEDLRAFDRSAKAIVLLNPIENGSYVLNCIGITSVFILICLGGLILWIHWIGVYTRDHEPTEIQQKAWQPSQLRKTAAAVGINGAILLFILLIGYQLLGNMSRVSKSNQESLDIMMARLENNSKEISSVKQEEEDWGIYFAGLIADLYSRIPECRNAEFLKKANELIGSVYIMVFDGTGKELLSSNGYVGFTLGDGINSNEDLRYLLQGIDRIVCEPETEKFSGKTLQMMGVSMDIGKEDAYGAVLLVIDPQLTWETTGTKELENYIKMLTHQENLSIIISQNNGKVAYTSDSDLSDKEPAEFGLDYTNLTPISLETFDILGIKRYGAFSLDDDYRYFFMMDAKYIWGDALKFAVFSALYYLLSCLVICLTLLGPFHMNKTEKTERLKERLKKKHTLSVDQEILYNFREVERGDRSVREWLHDMTPEQRIGRLMKISITVILLLVFIILLDEEKFGSYSVINFILHGSWKRGLNELAVAAIICCLVSLLSLILFKDLLVRVLNTMLNAKGKTIIGLVSSLVQYAAIITTVFFCLSYLGFDTSVLITSASILTLAISLGSKDLVADILSGIFIIFEGDFHVGDIIEVNGFKGKVIDIGVRSTKLMDSGSNIKIIDNQSVKNILNMSRETSLVIIDLTISNKQPLDEIEAMLDRELPKIGEQIPLIISGPHYFGIGKIGYHTVTINIGAVCQQSDITKIKSVLNHYLFEAFRDNGFQL